MATPATALALCVALLLAWPTDGEKRLPKPRDVRFAAEIAHHLLRWEPGQGSPSDVCYEVEHKVYGTNSSWSAVPDCMKISGHSCDLTYYTLVPGLRYYARVRAVSGNRTSLWQRTNAFSLQEAGLRLSGQSLSVRGNTIHVQLQLLLRAGNLTVKYDDIQKHTRQYRVYVRRAQDNRTFEEVKKAPEFIISNLFWDTEYCISVEPEVASRHTRAVRTAEQCLAVGHRDRSAELILSILSSSFITLLVLGLLGALLACTYIKKPVRSPSVLKSFIKQSSLWVDQESPSSGSPDADPVQQLCLCQKEPQKDSSRNSSPSTAQLPLQKGWKLPAWPEDQQCLLGLGAMGSRDSSCTSTDSGICLRSSELSCSSGHKPQGYKQQVPTGDDSGVGLGSSCPCPTCPSSSGMASEPPEAELSPSTLQQAMEFHGYLQQSQGTGEPQQDPDKGVPFLGHPSTTDIVLGAECSELPVAKGYLKQSFPEQLCSHTQDLAPWGALSCGAPGAPLDSKASPELLKAPFNLSIFNTDLLGMLPLVSSLTTTEWLQLQIQPLNLPDGDSKDSRL